MSWTKEDDLLHGYTGYTGYTDRWAEQEAKLDEIEIDPLSEEYRRANALERVILRVAPEDIEKYRKDPRYKDDIILPAEEGHTEKHDRLSNDLSRWAQLHRLEPSGLIFVDPTKSPYPVLRLDREEGAVRVDNKGNVIPPILTAAEIEEARDKLVLDNLERREKSLMEHNLEKTKLASAAIQYQKFVDLILSVPELAPSTKKKIGTLQTASGDVLTMTVGFRFAHYMTKKDKLAAVEAASKEFGVDWIFKLLFVLRSEDYPIQNWHTSGPYAATLFDDYTVLLYKTPEPGNYFRFRDTEESKSRPEPASYWNDKDIVGYRKVSWKEKMTNHIKSNPRSFIFTIISTLCSFGGLGLVAASTIGYALSVYIDHYDRKH